MNKIDEVFYAWLEQLHKISDLNDQLDIVRQQEDGDERKALAAALQVDVLNAKNVAAAYKQQLYKAVRYTTDGEWYIQPKTTDGGPMPMRYRVFLDGDRLEYNTVYGQ